MAVISVCGKFQDDMYSTNIIQGNGKNITAVWYSWVYHKKENRDVYANFELSFATVLSAQEIIDLSLSGKLSHCVIILDEMSEILNSIGEKGDVVKFIMTWIKQLRKMDIILIWIEQRYKDVHLRLRSHTPKVLEPKKYHIDGSLCVKENCERKDHLIYVYSVKPAIPIPLDILKAWIVGKLYDSSEVVLDSITISKDHVRELKEQRKINTKKSKFVIVNKLTEIKELIEAKRYDVIMEKYPEEYKILFEGKNAKLNLEKS